MITVQNLNKTYRTFTKKPGLLGSIASLFKREWIERHALKNVSFEAKRGEILGLLGENGAGKTTLIKILSGILHAPDGYVRVDGHDPYKRDHSFRRSIALVMGQKAQLWWDLPALDSFLLLKEIYSLSNADYESSLESLSNMLRVEHLLQIPLRRLSLGERMKMEIAASLLHRPSVIFLDEPTIGLDIKSQKAIRAFLLKYLETYRPLVILTSHYIQDIEALCKRVMILREGSVVYDGNLKQIRDFYRDERTVTVRVKNNDPALKEWYNSNAGVLKAVLLTDGDDFVQFSIPVESTKKLTNSVVELGLVDLRIESDSAESVIEKIQSGTS